MWKIVESRKKLGENLSKIRKSVGKQLKIMKNCWKMTGNMLKIVKNHGKLGKSLTKKGKKWKNGSSLDHFSWLFFMIFSTFQPFLLNFWPFSDA